MVAISRPIADPTLEAVDRAIEFRSSLEKARPYLGMSGVGETCERRLWQQFRWAVKEPRSAFLVKAAEDGHRTESLIADRLRLVEGVSVIALDPETGRQIAFEDLGGHFRGHADGAIVGLLQAPKSWSIWENKAREQKYLDELVKMKRDLGEKSALHAWDEKYYAQAILYMHYAGLNRHYLTCASPGGRNVVSVRTDADPVFALQLIEKARRIIFAATPPPRSYQPGFYKCGWCPFNGLCHEGAWPDRNCRTCLHSTPLAEGGWHCARWNSGIDIQTQRTGCPTHLLIPDLVPGKQVNAGDNWVAYNLRNGTTWTDSETHEHN